MANKLAKQGSVQDTGTIYCPVGEAIRYNRHDVLTYLIEKGMTMNSDNMTVIIKCQHVDMIARLVNDHSCMQPTSEHIVQDILKNVLFGAWETGSIDLAEYVERNMGRDKIMKLCEDMGLSLRSAFKTGNLEFFKKVCSWTDQCLGKETYWDWESFIEAGGQVEMVEWMMSAGLTVEMDDILLASVMHGHLALAKWTTLSKHHFADLMRVAVLHNHIDMVRYLHRECGCDFDEVSTDQVDISLDVLEYLADNRPQDKPILFTNIRVNTWSDIGWLNALQRVGMPTTCDRYLEFMIVNMDMNEILEALGNDEETISKLSSKRC
eukprot:gene20262-24300_t